MNSLLIVIPCWLDDAPKAEAVIDYMFHLNGRQKQGHGLVLVGPDVHPEYVERLKISCDVTFEGHTILHIPPWASPPTNKYQGVNYMLYAAAKTVKDKFGWAWIWVEPDCVPLRRGWLNTIADAYCAQPKRYMGMTLTVKPKDQPEANAQTFLTRTAVYPPDALNELEDLCKQTGNFMERNTLLLDRATRSTLIQNGHYDPATTTIRDDAVLYHADKNHELLVMLRDKLYPDKSGATQLHSALAQAMSHTGQPKLDGRSKEARAMKKKPFMFAGR